MLDTIMKFKLYSKNYSLNINIPKNIKEFNFEFCPIDSVFEKCKTDISIINEGKISVSPLTVKMTDYSALLDMKKIFDI